MAISHLDDKQVDFLARDQNAAGWEGGGNVGGIGENKERSVEGCVGGDVNIDRRRLDGRRR